MTKQAKWTPGPWSVSNAPNGERCIRRQGETNPLAGIAWTGEPSPAFGEYTIEANARLIAAAPLMVEALQLMLVRDEALAEHFGNKWPLDLSTKNAVKRARAALAAAEERDDIDNR